MNILKQSNSDLQIANVSDVTQTEKPNKISSGAYSPVGKAPIAHMDSEDDVGMNSARRENPPPIIINDKNRTNKLDLSAEQGMLFSQEIFYEALKESNKEAQRLLQVLLLTFFYVKSFLSRLNPY